MKLKDFISKLQNERTSDSDAGLKNSAEGERYLQQSYEGRYLFELIQNSRDANKLANIRGRVIIEVLESKLVISNTGQPFDEKGIDSITLIGSSTKGTQGFIGFKGIGFKSILEISENPIVIMPEGSIEFSRLKTKKLLANRTLRADNVPLFFIPHYSPMKLAVDAQDSDIVTRIELPFKEKVDTQDIRNAFAKISVEQIVLMGYLKIVKFIHGEYESTFEITEDEKKGIITVDKNAERFRFRHFTPTNEITIPDEIIESLEGKEREMFDKESFIDISLVFSVDEKNRLCPIDKSKLYLFYPTEITSGFGFIIHSYFIVNPERKALRDSRLNEFIFEQVADFITGEWLSEVQKNFKGSYLDLLAYTRNMEFPIINKLYDKLTENLKKVRFIYDPLKPKFYKWNEVIIADGFAKGLFPEHKLRGKRLVYFTEKKTRDWLSAEFEVEYLSYDRIAECIEQECLAQKKKKNYGYFSHLYNYSSEHKNFNLEGRKILLTSSMKLLTSNDDVFHGFKGKLKLPQSVSKKIHFIHPSIKISNSRDYDIGFTEFRTDLFVRRLLRLFNDKTVPNCDILKVLLSLDISEGQFPEIREQILLPVRTEMEWVNPLYIPVYVENENLKQLYPDEKFVDTSAFEDFGLDITTLTKKLIEFGAWDIPAVFYNAGKYEVKRRDSVFSKLMNIEYFSTDQFEVVGDWHIDLPAAFTPWFTKSVITNWPRYKSIINSNRQTSVKYTSGRSYYRNINTENALKISSFLRFLSDQKWIKLENDDKTYSLDEIFGIGHIEHKQGHSYILKKFLTLLPIDYKYHEDFIKLTGLIHLDTPYIEDFKKILNKVASENDTTSQYSKEFENFYNKILGKLYDLFNDEAFDKSTVTQLGDVAFLAINEFEQSSSFVPSKDIFHIEDKAGYDLLPDEIKKEIQPHFTNRDRNRFGKIAKRLGRDFKKVFSQQVEIPVLDEQLSFIQWMHDYGEALALTEELLQIEITDNFALLRKVKINLCSGYSVAVYRDNELLRIRKDVPFIIQNKNDFEIFIHTSLHKHLAAVKSDIFYSLLTDVLGRDISRIRVQLAEFFNSVDKVSFLVKYDVPLYRVNEIKEKFDDTIVSKLQQFWIPVIQLKGDHIYLPYLVDENIDFAKVAQLISCSQKELEDLNSRISFDNMTAETNMQPLKELFTIINLDLIAYNSVSLFKIDFAGLYNRKLEAIHVKYKQTFSKYLHIYLSSRDISEKSRFQDLFDGYTNSTLFKISHAVLDINVNEVFMTFLLSNYIHLNLPSILLSIASDSTIQSMYAHNLSVLKCSVNCSDNMLDEFLESNVNRSLLYFENTLDELLSRFTHFGEKITENSSEVVENSLVLGLNKYQNLPALDIKSSSTTSVAVVSSLSKKGTPIGKRVDGSKTNDETQSLIGIVAEKAVYEILVEKYKIVEWMSKNAAKAEVNPEGSDAHGYDMYYIDENEEIQFVEVKGKSSSDRHFFISSPEYHFALQKKENYRILQVFNTLDNENRKIEDIGNVFLLNENEELFNNSKFTAHFTNLEIIYN